MKYLKLKKYLPRSFFGRALLIIILPIIWDKSSTSKTKRGFVHRIFNMASTLHVLADERARDEAIAMIRLGQDPFELVAKRA